MKRVYLSREGKAGHRGCATKDRTPVADALLGIVLIDHAWQHARQNAHEFTEDTSGTPKVESRIFLGGAET